MHNIGKYIIVALFAFVLGLGYAAVSQAAEPNMAAIADQIDQKSYELDQEMASSSPNRGKIERLSREIGELRGKQLASGAGSQYDRRAYYGPRGGYYGRGGCDWFNYHHGYRGGYHHGRHGCW